MASNKKKKPTYEDLIGEAVGNIRSDRKKINAFIDEILLELKRNKQLALNKEMAIPISKYFESLSRTNEQLVKITSIESKNYNDDELTENDIDAAYEDIQEEVEEEKQEVNMKNNDKGK
jgi:hypothetical protein